MMASSSELSLDCKPQHTYSMLLKSFGEQQQQNDHHTSQKLEEFLARLEEERLKIDAFKRELPLCMQLLTNAMEASRQQLQSYKANNNQGARPVLEEFIPLKNSLSSSCDINGGSSVEKMAIAADKANWMTSAQLWSDQGNETESTKQHRPISASSSPKENDNLGFSVSPKVIGNHDNGGGGAFLPFSKDRSSANSGPTPTLALASCDDHNNMEADNNSNKNISETVNNNNNNPSTVGQQDGQTTSQPQRKARRCWSPDLHRRFVNALQMLGGSQVATPKQIRELMKVDGLTNDEVKSHLQKYRLHTRRPIPSPQTGPTGAPQLVVIGGIWVPPEYATAAAAAVHSGGAPPAATLYGAHHPTAVHAHAAALSQQQHYCAAPQVGHHEFYAASPPPPHQAALHQYHHQLHMYKPPSHAAHTHSSPVSGDRSESIEDGKSSASGGSWKADSGGSENGGERKVLGLRDDGEVGNNATEISLKF